MDHCSHCTYPGDPRHGDPVFAKSEAGCAFYENPENLRTRGPGHKRAGSPARLTSHVPVRFSRDTIAAVKLFSDEDGMTVSTWIRHLVDREIQRRTEMASHAHQAPA